VQFEKARFKILLTGEGTKENQNGITVVLELQVHLETDIMK
jgi:hypothetical protein